MAWILKILLSIIIDIIDFFMETVGIAVSPIWNVIQLVLIMVLWPSGGSLVMSAIDFIPGISGFFPAATISGMISGMTHMD
jgi:hypothetical protein